MQTKTLKELAEHVNATVFGDGNIKISSASTLDRAGEGDITFLANDKYEKQLLTTKAAAVVVGRKFQTASEKGEIKTALLIAENPYYAFTQIMVLLFGHRKHKNIGVSEKASISATAQVGENCDIHDFVVIADDVKIGSGCTIYPGVYIAEGVTIGSDCIIYPSVTIYDGSIIGERVIINANSTVGEDGFGFATSNGSHHKIPQIGIAILEDDVEIGTCCAIERGTLDDTVIGKGSKLGDLIAIGHGTKIGEHCLLVAQVGVAGSARLGNYCVVGGQAGIVGHINIGNGVQIAAQSGVINDVADGKAIFGSPAVEAGKARRAYSLIQYLPEMRQKIRKLQKRLDKITSSNNPDSQESNK